MHAAVIINPISGRGGRSGLGRRRADAAARALADLGVTGTVGVTEGPGHAYELARQAVAGGAGLVFAWGGDGTVNEVGRALAFGPAALAIVRAGSGNGLARELGVDARPAQAMAAALRAPERRIDAGELDGRLFFNLAGVGVDARVAARFGARAQGRRGMLPYVTLAARELLAYDPPSLRIAADGRAVFDDRVLLVALANSRQYGSGAVVAPRAVLDDGALDLVIVEPRPVWRALWDARRLFDGTIDRAAGVHVRRVRAATLSGQAPLLCHVDGESFTAGSTVRARVHPGALRIRM